MMERFKNFESARDHMKQLCVVHKAHKRLQKYANDKLVINNRKLHDPACQIVAGHDQDAWFVKLENNRIWDKVFDHLTKPTDISNAYFACEMFRKHLENKRKTVLIPEVFRVLRTSRHLVYTGFDLQQPFHMDNDGEALYFKAVNKCESRDILNLRLVCKTWKRAAEEAFLIPVNKSKTPLYWNPELWNWNSPMVFRIETVKDVDKAMHKLSSIGMSGPLLRLLVVNCSRDQDCDRFFDKMNLFLEVHGLSIWGFFLIIRDYTCFRLNRFVDMICRMSKLKAMWLRLPVGHYLNLTDQQISNEKSRLSQDIQKQSFPVLEELECLCLDCDALYDAVVVEVLTKSANLKGFQWDQRDQELRCSVWEAVKRVPLLTYLRIVRFGSYASRDIVTRDFVRLSQLDLPLRHLQLNYFPSHGNFDIDVNLLFNGISRFSNSLLEFVSLDDRRLNFVIGDPDGVVLPEFPNLEHVQFDDMPSFMHMHTKICI